MRCCFRPRFRPTLFLLFVLSVTVRVPSGRAQILYQHSGSGDPVALEGWGLDAPGPGAVVGPINDSGTEAWFVDDDSTGSGSNRYYVRFPSATETAAANSFGWNLKVNLRVVDIGDSSPLGSPLAVYEDGPHYFAMFFGTQADGDPVVHLPSQFSNLSIGPSFALEGAGSGYHSYQMRYDPLASSVDMYVDGIERISNFGGIPSVFAVSELFWGCAALDTGQGNFNLVQFAVIPEPSTVVLVGLLTLAAIGTGKFRRRPYHRVKLD